MTEKITPTHEIHMGTMSLNDQPIEVFQATPDFPDNEKKADVCYDHLSALGPDMVDDFWMMGAHFPEEGEEQVVRMQFSCKGVSCILKKCGLKLRQYDEHGEVLTTGRIVKLS